MKPYNIKGPKYVVISVLSQVCCISRAKANTTHLGKIKQYTLLLAWRYTVNPFNADTYKIGLLAKTSLNGHVHYEVPVVVGV